MKIVVLDSHPLDDGDLDWSPLREMGELVFHPNTRPEDVLARIADAQIVLSNKVKLPQSTLQSASALELISVLATGYDIVDIEAARAQNITVCNVPSYSSASTAQTTIALLLELCHRVGDHSQGVHDGEWSRASAFSYWKFPLVDLEGKTLLIVGLGDIGRRVAHIARALGLNVVAAQLSGREAKTDEEFPRRDFDAALPDADVVSLHCPLTPQTRSLMNSERLARLKPSALLINAARGPLVDEIALGAALDENHLAGYAADVLSQEPPPPDHPLFGAPNCILTPHIAWATPQSRQRNLRISIENVRSFLSGTPQNVVS